MLQTRLAAWIIAIAAITASLVVIVAGCIAFVLLVRSHAERSIFRMKDFLFPTFLVCCGDFQNQHNMPPSTINDITNLPRWNNYFEPFEKEKGVHRTATIKDLYYIRTSNAYECGSLYEELPQGTKISVYSEFFSEDEEWSMSTNIFLPTTYTSACELVRTGFSGVTVTGMLQIFVDDQRLCPE